MRLVLLMLLVSLTAWADYAIYGFSPEYTQQINSILTEVDAPKFTKVYHTPLEDDQLGRARLDAYPLCVIEVTHEYPVPLLRTILYHEYGHCLGIMHSPNVHSIMYPKVDPIFKYPKPYVEKFVQYLRSRRSR